MEFPYRARLPVLRGFGRLEEVSRLNEDRPGRLDLLTAS
jgi:hypothetical protein